MNINQILIKAIRMLDAEVGANLGTARLMTSRSNNLTDKLIMMRQKESLQVSEKELSEFVYKLYGIHVDN